jgi:hypothetical protein
VPKGQDAKVIDVTNTGGYSSIDLNATNSTNPNALAQDWVLGRHALLLTDSSSNLTPFLPYGQYLNQPITTWNISGGVPGSPTLGNGMCDVANFTLKELINGRVAPAPPPFPIGLASSPNTLNYQGRLLDLMYTRGPLLTAAKPLGLTDNMQSWDVSPTHTYFMGGVSDFIVEWAGDAVMDTFYDFIPPGNVQPDGILDRDPDGRIKWYTALNPNPITAGNNLPPNRNAPITYPAPPTGVAPLGYPPHVNPAILGFFSRTDAAFAWQHAGSPGFTQWPWMIRVRYRLHDRRGQFEGREITVAGNTEPEKGLWYETVIQVNYQNLP